MKKGENGKSTLNHRIRCIFLESRKSNTEKIKVKSKKYELWFTLMHSLTESHCVVWFCGFVVLWFGGFVVLWFCGFVV